MYKQILLGLLLNFGLTLAHSPSDAGINIYEEEDYYYLKINTTPKTAIDLARFLYPELEGRNIRLDDFTADFETYFNNRIHLEINGKRIALKLYDHKLSGHDSHLEFELIDFTDDIQSCYLEVNALEIYSRAHFFVSIPQGESNKRYILNRADNSCSNNVRLEKSSNNSRNPSDTFFAKWYWIIVAVPIALTRFIYFRRK